MHKRQWLFAVFIAVIAVLLGMPASASPPALYLQVGNDPLQEFNNWTYNNGIYSLNFNAQGTGWLVGGSVAAQADPFIAYGVSVQNFTGSDLPFTMIVVDPINPIVGPNIVYSSISGSGTDVSGDGFSIMPLAPEFTTLQSTWLNVGSVNAGVDIGNAFVEGPGLPGESNNFGFSAAGPLFGPEPGPWNDLDLLLGFNLSGGGDIATLNGFSSIVPVPAVPEPASALLLGVGLIGSAILMLRKRR